MSKHTIFDDPVGLVEQGLAVWSWADMYLTHPNLPGVKLRVRTMKEPMKLAAASGRLVRFCVSASELQEIADRIDGIFHTARTLDARHKQAGTIMQPIVLVDNDFGDKSTDERMSEVLDAQLDALRTALGKDDLGIVSTTGKPWVLSRYMLPKYARRYGDKTAHCYGWHSNSGRYKSPDGQGIWQQIIAPDSPDVADDERKGPANTADLLSQSAQIIHDNGDVVSVRLSDVYQHEEFWRLVSYEGPLPVRQPSVPRYVGSPVLPPVNIPKE